MRPKHQVSERTETSQDGNVTGLTKPACLEGMGASLIRLSQVRAFQDRGNGG
jgi:hypothetical protein